MKPLTLLIDGDLLDELRNRAWGLNKGKQRWLAPVAEEAIRDWLEKHPLS